MKRKLLAVFLAAAMTLSLMAIPAFAEPDAEEDIFHMGDTSYSTLKAAVESLGQSPAEGTTITLTGKFDSNGSDMVAIPQNVTLVVEEGATFNLSLLDATSLLASEGAATIMAGGTFILSQFDFVFPAMI